MEAPVQFLWQHRLWKAGALRLCDGRRVDVIDPGRQNHGPGPDFFNAKIRLDGRVWAGDVEVHERASDWFRHGHDKDPAYDSVVLHVVTRDDCEVRRRAGGGAIAQLVVECTDAFRRRYDELVSRSGIEMPCADEIGRTDSVFLSDWLGGLALERLYEKAARIENLLGRMSGDWRQACFVVLARALGFGTNGDCLERLAAGMPLRVLDRHSDDPAALEALLLGRSGLLDLVTDADPAGYVGTLRREWDFLRVKYGLTVMESPRWRRGGMRPSGLPERRVAMLARMTLGGFDMAGRIMEVEDADRARELFDTELTGYWSTHYGLGPGAGGGTVPCRLNARSVDVLIINVVAPVMVARGLAVGDAGATGRAVSMLEAMAPERNSVVEAMERAGVKARDALTTQAIIGLRRNYCEAAKCLYCKMGNRALRRCL